jgi:hypothetical protein
VSRRCRPELRVPVGKITHLRGCFQCCVAGRWCSVGYLQLCLQRHVRPFARLHCSYHPLTGDSPALLVLSHLAHRRLANLPRPHCLYLTTDSPLWGGFVTSPSPLSMWWFRPLSWAVVYVSFFSLRVSFSRYRFPSLRWIRHQPISPPVPSVNVVVLYPLRWSGDHPPFVYVFNSSFLIMYLRLLAGHQQPGHQQPGQQPIGYGILIGIGCHPSLLLLLQADYNGPPRRRLHTCTTTRTLSSRPSQHVRIPRLPFRKR